MADFYDSAYAPMPIVGEFQDLWRYRSLLTLLVVNSLKTRYKRSFFGLAWTLFNPLIQMAVLAIAFSSIFRGALIRYPVYVLAGLICWNFFVQATTHSMNTLVWGSGLLKRIYMPRTIFVFVAVGNGLINLCLAMVPLLLIMLAMGHPLYAAWWFVPVAVFLLALFASGVALLVSILAVFFGDTVDIYQALVQALFFITPVMYPKDILPQRYAWFLELNPVHRLLELFRSPIYLGRLPDDAAILTAAAWAFGAFLLGWWAFTRKVDELAYRI
ncbi:MAG: ABC transporter permease [Elusimicrobiota bacterium]